MKKYWVTLVIVLLGWFAGNACFAQVTPSYDGLVQQGKTQLQAGDNDAALTSANAAIKANADRWEAYAVAGGALINLKRCDEAIAQLNDAVRNAPAGKQSALQELLERCRSSGSSLDVTMKFIQTKVNSVGPINWTATTTNSADNSTSRQTYTDQNTILSTDLTQCVLKYRHSGVSNGDPGSYEVFLPLTDIRDVELEPWEQYINHVNSLAVSRGRVVTASVPATLYLALNRPNKKGHLGMSFQDSVLASQVAAALTHAIALCGDQRNESVAPPAQEHEATTTASSAQDGGPTLQETSDWLAKTLKEYGGIYYNSGQLQSALTDAWIGEDCTFHHKSVGYEWKENRKLSSSWTEETAIPLGAVTSLRSSINPNQEVIGINIYTYPISAVQIDNTFNDGRHQVTTDDQIPMERSPNATLGGEAPQIPSEIIPRVEKALKHAVDLCRGTYLKTLPKEPF